MKIDGKCYDEIPPPPEELKPMLEALFQQLLDDGDIDAESYEMNPKVYFAMWWEEIVGQ